MRNKEPLVSVIVPVYNVEKYVEKCLTSLIRQSYENLEIVVVDDGSTDGSGKICDKLAEQDVRLVVFHKENGGLSDARNFGIKKAKGGMIALVDGDDYVKVDYIAEMVKKMQESGADVVICGFNNEIPDCVTMSGKEATIKLLTRQENLEIVAWNKLYRRDLFVKNEIWYPVGEKNEDSLTTYKLLAVAKKVTYVGKILYHYVTRGGSIMNRVKMEERLKMRERAAMEAVGYFSGDGDLKQAAEVAVLLAKYAYMDAAARGEIGSEYYKENLNWVKKHKKKCDGNKYMTTKLKFYNILCGCVGGWSYKMFRKIRHE